MSQDLSLHSENGRDLSGRDGQVPTRLAKASRKVSLPSFGEEEGEARSAHEMGGEQTVKGAKAPLLDTLSLPNEYYHALEAPAHALNYFTFSPPGKSFSVEKANRRRILSEDNIQTRCDTQPSQSSVRLDSIHQLQSNKNNFQYRFKSQKQANQWRPSLFGTHKFGPSLSGCENMQDIKRDITSHINIFSNLKQVAAPRKSFDETKKEILGENGESDIFRAKNDRNSLDFADKNIEIIPIKLEKSAESSLKNQKLKKSVLSSKSQIYSLKSPASVTSVAKKSIRKARRSKKQDCCNCKNSKCLRLHCRCFKKLGFCGPSCKCTGCLNLPEFDEAREFVIAKTKEINKQAFVQKIVEVEETDKELVNSQGCRCKTGCLRNYCECARLAGGCSPICKCLNCQNMNKNMEKDNVKKYFKFAPRKKDRIIIKDLTVESLPHKAQSKFGAKVVSSVEIKPRRAALAISKELSRPASPLFGSAGLENGRKMSDCEHFPNLCDNNFEYQLFNDFGSKTLDNKKSSKKSAFFDEKSSKKQQNSHSPFSPNFDENSQNFGENEQKNHSDSEDDKNSFDAPFNCDSPFGKLFRGYEPPAGRSRLDSLGLGLSQEEGLGLSQGLEKREEAGGALGADAQPKRKVFISFQNYKKVSVDCRAVEGSRPLAKE